MSTQLDLHRGPAAGFDEPFELLLECHRRVARMLRLLERLARHLRAAGPDDAARGAAADVMRYFDTAGPAHHEDEARHVLPALVATGEPALVALANRLAGEHADMERAWQHVRADLDGVTRGRWPADAPTACEARWSAFAALYRSHLEAEESVAYPSVAPRLDGVARAAMGDEMARRRGVR
jgi:hemerythrin-like domain-containing protein